jgi:AmmeMemoRadiSam system protein B
MYTPDREHPRLRPLEAIPDPDRQRIILRDPTQLASGALVVGAEQFTLLTLLDGRRRVEIQSEFARRFRQLLLSEDLDRLLDQLDAAGFLEGSGFDRYYQGLTRQYLEAPHRPLRDPDSFGAPVTELPTYLDGIIDAAANDARTRRGPARTRGRLAGIIAPHLDFERGLPCYGDGYHHVRQGERPRRVVVLGTNHFGRSRSVVGTDKDFETPWGVLPTDREFLARLQAECGGELMPYPLDHLREHSVELHSVWLHHVLGDQVRIVPFLCPDPSGPRGTAPGDAGGVDVREFALALGKLVREDPEPTLIVASADLSHVGRYFGEDCSLTDGYLQEVRKTDETALSFVEANDPEGFRTHMAETQNPTSICSVGCIYAAMVALGGEATPHALRYHQAVTLEMENAVTCASFAFYS